MIILLSHNNIMFAIYAKFLKKKKRKNKKAENHVTILVLIDFCTSLGRAKRPKCDVQNVLNVTCKRPKCDVQTS